MEGRGARSPACGALHLRHRGEGRRGSGREGMEVGEEKAVGRRVGGSPRRCGGRSAWGRGPGQGVTRQGRGAGWGRYRRRWGGAEVGPRALGRGPDGGPSVSGARAGRGGAGSWAAPPSAAGKAGRTGSGRRREGTGFGAMAASNVLLVMGVSGSGKSTVGALLASEDGNSTMQMTTTQRKIE
ncbi:probable gluconokinase isoform X2 [Bubalus bubalis]|uniref:probable gluconokinase isoform X2 n=1 Tax=Bubalus bubalis TaxID=89462 RepID=UPI001E1B8B55|nr:probable gluconokinase isoform X2 [Bubalus bubalis]XP_044796162.2 probable gluconokinase isoform X2 [Bubalus bubalis]XP_044796163.2 probable gluconokinase isoform X2 [Bubalus bubalis]XP_044796164.2 probable gluconokinase isoform X2 [Bubalus bubalis]XP_044796165.2 probable gluconokinase isoform X2 [Bubalus bubalis]XP_044796166.2 probable gluconokinase isoform X2 [Bubalus bubalis]